MCKGKSLWLCIIATLMLTTIAIAQGKDRNPDEKQLDGDRGAQTIQSSAMIFVRQAMIPLLQQASKGVSQRYNLDEANINELRKSISKLVETLLEQPEAMRTLGTAGWRQRDWEAVARYLTAWLDQQLSLTVDQREKIEQRLIPNANRDRLVDARDILWNRLRPADVVRQRLKYPPDDVLSQTQLLIWEQLVVSPKFKIREQIPEHAKAIVAKIKADIMEGRINGEEIELRIQFREDAGVEVMTIEVRDEDKDNGLDSQEKMKRLVEAKLAAHTEQLGPLDENASQRLTLAAKGVVEEYLEAQGKDWNSKYEEAEKEIREAVTVGKIAPQQAAQKLKDLKKQLHAKERATNSDTNITHHPLYQQTIEDVLSDEGFAQYKARQMERQGFRQQALREVLVESMDTELFLNREQRKHFETTVAELPIPPATNEVPAPVYMAYQLLQRTDRELLNPWQQEEFERIHRELERQVKLVKKR